MMKLTKLKEDKDNNKLTFELKDVDIAFANALRRSIVELVPTMAIEDVELRKNSSALYDELLAHRLGLIPLTTDLSSYKMAVEGEEPSATTHLSIKLKAEGPSDVKASDLESSDPKVIPAHPDMLITTLLKGQQVELEAKAILGRGKEHMKWSPGLAFYHYKQKLTLGKIKDAKRILELAPSDVLSLQGDKLIVNEDKLLTTDIAGAFEEVKGEINVEELPEQLIFTVESWGQLSPKEILIQAAEQLSAELQQLSDLL